MSDEEHVEDLDVPESEGEDVKGGAIGSNAKIGDIKGQVNITDGTSIKQAGSLNFWK